MYSPLASRPSLARTSLDPGPCDIDTCHGPSLVVFWIGRGRGGVESSIRSVTVTCISVAMEQNQQEWKRASAKPKYTNRAIRSRC